MKEAREERVDVVERRKAKKGREEKGVVTCQERLGVGGRRAEII